MLDGRVDLALGNVVGSNLFNVLFILGVSALITPLAVDRQLIRQEVPVMVGASLLLLAFALDREIGRVDGIVLFALAVVYTVVLIVQARRSGAADSPAGSVPDDDATSPGMPSSAWSSRRSVQLLLIVTGVALLVVGARLLVAAAVTFAQTLGMSERVIGLTIVAAGTSLPEVATSVVAAFRGQRDIAIGNVVGSNIFNILCVAGLSAAVSATALPVGPSTLSSTCRSSSSSPAPACRSSSPDAASTARGHAVPRRLRRLRELGGAVGGLTRRRLDPRHDRAPRTVARFRKRGERSARVSLPRRRPTTSRVSRPP